MDVCHPVGQRIHTSGKSTQMNSRHSKALLNLLNNSGVSTYRGGKWCF
jgi:hypothetical protein